MGKILLRSDPILLYVRYNGYVVSTPVIRVVYRIWEKLGKGGWVGGWVYRVD